MRSGTHCRTNNNITYGAMWSYTGVQGYPPYCEMRKLGRSLVFRVQKFKLFQVCSSAVQLWPILIFLSNLFIYNV